MCLQLKIYELSLAQTTQELSDARESILKEVEREYRKRYFSLLEKEGKEGTVHECAAV